MERRAGPLLANRSLSALIVVSFVLSAFAGLYIVASPAPAAAQSDLVVTEGTVTIEDIEHYPVDGDVLVSGTGTLIVRNSGLEVMSNYGAPRTVTVGAGGTLALEHGVLTSYLNQIEPWPFLTLTIEDGGVVMATDSSLLSFPGSIIVQNGGELTLYDSSIEQIPDEDLSQYIAGSTYVTMDSADDGPAIVVTDATLMMFDSSITDLPEFPVDAVFAGNLTLYGDSTFLAVNSYIDVDFGPVATLPDYYAHNALVLDGTSSAHLYGSYFEPYTGTYSARAPAIIADGESYIAPPTAEGPEDTTGESISDLVASGDGLTYQIGPGETMAIDAFDAGPSMTVDGATLCIRYAVTDTYDGTQSFTWREEGA
ncbi:MAG: hypothetical protein QG582_1257, partial [Candidatus Thermoplasmatota archaeon]|nr:hypothetical protein [Candidatus Thermoplasmatota archaeon]